ncbi:DUF3344 domain-containing protein [Polyangium sorediatum]|uniref:DUF3344 domain-containing protein n=1 Tax=Polyangium sorediatum TaxID=889274 RepID=A0ABT6NQN4_9BACT|nr:DUF3344 domain-containing protein [Polyangium sorediatum]MDI1430623.1 DUF3344 domain-containing protein [Polyangium sorediatum]
MRRRTALGGIVATLVCGAAGTASAEPALRVQVTQRGDFALIGNTLAQDCGANVPAPVVPANFNKNACGLNTSDTAPDVYFRADDPGAGQVSYDLLMLPGLARTTANLSLPVDATVTHAYLYWGARSVAGVPDLSVTLERPGSFSEDITVMMSDVVMGNSSFITSYQAVADVTELVKQHGSGAYRLGGVDAFPLANVNNATPFAGWWMVVLYELQSEPPRNMALFDGFEEVTDGASSTATISGFKVPLAGYNAKLGVVAYEGDNGSVGDSLSWNGTTLSNALNPANDFFNSTRSFLGMPVSVVGDLPQLTGGLGSMSGIDLDVLDITGNVMPGSTSAAIEAASQGDTYVLGGFITSISTLKPDFTTSAKSVSDLNGGVVDPGDELEYTLLVTNTGDDTSKDTILTDKLPAEVTYVPGSLEIVSGPNMGAKTDATADDQGDFDAGSGTVTVRLGTGANATLGGSLNVGQSTSVRFRVTVNPGVGGSILNQGVINASGTQGAPAEDTPTDGNGGDPGAPPTVIIIDSDGDGLSNDDENAAGTNPNDADSDDDGVPDGDEPQWNIDSDGDGLINALDPDSDNDGLLDGTELGLDCSNPATDASKGACRPDADMGATKTDPLDADTDNGGVGDGSEDGNLNGQIDPGEGDPNDPSDDNTIDDTDGDGLSDIVEATLGSNPNDADSDDDGVIDGDEPNPGIDTDGDGVPNVLDADSDNDGLFDGTELGLDCSNPATDTSAGTCRADADMGATKTSPIDADTDDGGVSDGSEDTNLNGQIDPGETDPNIFADDSTNTDTDGDGLSDKLEETLGTNPNDADSDDDGVPDGQEPNPAEDSDGDGLINALDPDSDNDGLLDGTELGYDCNGPGTNKAVCVPDADMGATKTSPINPDTDGGGIKDGSEDSNLNGQIDPGEKDPNDPSDDSTVVDTDGDGLSDDLEEFLGSDPNDADSDDDGVPDGQEPNPSADTDGDGLINVLDADSDNDGLFDGTELGLGCDNDATDASAGRCVPDGDMGATKTNPLDADTDDGGLSDGSEDWNLNGVVDPGEGDPNTPGDDNTILDTDGDGLSDELEGFLGSDPMDADTDDDGVIDGKEPNPAEDTDGDGIKNVVDPDSDNDGLPDGLELGLDCSNPATDPAANICKPDADMGATTTSPINADTDHGGIADGVEDANGDGAVDGGETDPNDPSDDMACATDADCGGETSGMVCNPNKACVEGCRGVGGNGCPTGLECTSMDSTIGQCVEPTGVGGAGGAGGAGGEGGVGGGGTGGAEPDDGIALSGGCSGCAVASDDDASRGLLAALGAALLAFGRRRRRA